MPIPKDISIEENENKKVVISWNGNEHKINFSDRIKMKYSIELTYGNNKSTYETSEPKLVLEKFLKDTNYKVRIKMSINESSSIWSKEKEFKIDELIKKNGLFGINTIFSLGK